MQCLLANIRFYVDLHGKKRHWRTQKNEVPQGSTLAPALFNIYTIDQPISNNTRSFIYADDIAIATKSKSFNKLEDTLSKTLTTMSTYYIEFFLKLNPAKTQVCAFHFNNTEAHKKLNINWNGEKLQHTQNPVYLGITLDRTLSYKAHNMKTKAKINARNNMICKLANSRGGANPSTLRTSALVLCYSVAQYACPVWQHSRHAKKLDPALKNS